MTKISRTARKQCWQCEQPLDIRHDNYVMRVYHDDMHDKKPFYFHMDCSDKL